MVVNRLFILLLLLSLSACQITGETKLQVAEMMDLKKSKTLSCDAETPNHCATATPYHQVFEKTESDKKNRMQLFEKGTEALIVRLHLIRSATRSIDIQTFIWSNDDVGELMMRELIAAAQRGVKVRILADQLYSFSNSRLLAQIATKHDNLSLKLYNPIFGGGHTSPIEFATAITCCLWKVNRRMHNKTFIVDNRYGISGGRNYDNRYFDWGWQFNYKDRDVLAIGPVVKQMTDSFEHFWDSQYSIAAEHLLDVSQRIINHDYGSIAWLEPLSLQAKFALKQADDYTAIEQQWLPELITVDKAEFFSDDADKPFKKKHNPQLTEKIRQMMGMTKHSLLMQTPYLVFSRQARRFLRKLRKRNPDYQFIVSTNSLSATDAYPVYAISYKHRRYYLKKLGMQIYEFKTQPEDWDKMFGFGRINGQTRYGLHGKSFVVDNRYVMIGTHNFDPRSANFNTEAGFIVDSPILANRLSNFIKTDIKAGNSWVVAARERTPVLSNISDFFATISRALPTLDIWPFRYATSFELKENHRQVPPNHPDFYKNYRPVGDFPAVELPLKQIQTIIISAFAGFSEPIM